MASRDKQSHPKSTITEPTEDMTLLERYLKHEYRYMAVFLGLILFTNATILATSIIMEAHRANQILPVWQPFFWEYTSALAHLPMALLVIWLSTRFPINWLNWHRYIWLHIAGSLVYSSSHILLMVGLRKLIMGLFGSRYDFGNIAIELLYEYRKDAWTYIILIALSHLCGFIISRLRGEALVVSDGEAADNSNSERVPDRLLVKKLGREFIIKIKDIEWLESSGNYVNLHIGNRIYPLKSTLGKLTSQLTDRGFMRVHRSYGVNLDYVDSIEPLESGDAIIKLKSNINVNLSRRYREEFKSRLGT